MTSQIPSSDAGDNPDVQTLAAIRDVMRKDPRKLTLAGRHTRGADRLPPLDAPEPSQRRGRFSWIGARGVSRLQFSKLRRRHFVWAVLALGLVFRPWWILAPVLIMGVSVIGAFTIWGKDGVWDRVLNGLDRYTRWRPERGVRLTRRLDLWAEKWDGVLDRLPERWAEALAMPCFNDRAAQAAAHEARLDQRYANMDRVA